MNTTTLFNLGEIVYLIEDAAQGNLIPLIVEKISVFVETTAVVAIKYQVSSTNKFHNTTYFEAELETYEDAKNRAETVLNTEITQLQQDISNL